MPRVCWEEQLCVSCEFVTKFAVYGFFAEHRDALTSEIKSMLEAAEFDGTPIDEQQARRIIREGQTLLDSADACANHLDKCTSF